jgi:hypothetical protein
LGETSKNNSEKFDDCRTPPLLNNNETALVDSGCNVHFLLKNAPCLNNKVAINHWVPNTKARLLSPQKLFKKSHGIFGRYAGDEDTFSLYLNNHPPITVEYDHRSSLPIGYAHTGAVSEPQVNVALIDENQNLSEGQKLLLEWHTRCGHLNFPRVHQVLRHVPFIAKKLGPALRCDAPKCHTCEIAKAKRRARKSTLQTKVTERDGALTSGHVKVGARVSVDHFESRLQGRTYD